jgi:hypothetical protein
MSKKLKTEVNGISLPWEVVDAITLASLQESKKILKKEMRKHLKHGEYMHPEDFTNNGKYSAALNILIKYYGG